MSFTILEMVAIKSLLKKNFHENNTNFSEAIIMLVFVHLCVLLL